MADNNYSECKLYEFSRDLARSCCREDHSCLRGKSVASPPQPPRRQRAPTSPTTWDRASQIDENYSYNLHITILAMHSLTVASRPRMSYTKPKWFVFETSCYAFGERIRRLAKLNVNKVNLLYIIEFILVASCSFLCTLSLY